MTSRKYALFDKDLQESAILFKALAHPARLAILNFLAESKICMTGDISGELPLSRSTVNQHLTELRNAGLIKGEIDGVRVNYCLNTSKIEEVKLRLGQLFEYIEKCC